MSQLQPPPSTAATSFSHNLVDTLASDHHCNSCLLCLAIIFVVCNNLIGIPFRLLCASFFLHYHVVEKLHGCTIFAPRRSRRNAYTRPHLVFSDSSRSPLQHCSCNLWQPRYTAVTCQFRRVTISSSKTASTTDLHGFLFVPPSTSNHYSTGKPPW
ncbi:hypothetical protein DEO72_LG5g2303 [Vigna unguiculata]|uniref:Uncharacterized protein n=1 Tax=Vigna unguiculata TaxID=3917 RepID=A0A4D6LZD4_VIGUN|nr:hypothetical protein DEO72_LG5g2303 [Vigna unguiculata]